MFPQLLDSGHAAASCALDAGTRGAIDSIGSLDSIARPALAGVISLVATLLAGRFMIPWLRRRAIAPSVSNSATLNALHAHKRDTPTMGGLFVVLALTVALAACADLRQANVQAALGLAWGLAAVGAADDLLKCRGHRRGLSARSKLAGQFAIAAAAILWLRHGASATAASGTMLSSASVDLALLGAIIWIVAASNAVNLTDGLDGLAAGCTVWAAAGMSAIAGWRLWSAQSVANPQELAGQWQLLILLTALGGAALGFLVFNRRPARVFLGDTGSLPLGGLLGWAALASGDLPACLVVLGVFAVELASVALQVSGYKLTGCRLFRCAPLHHHFQFAGWNEARVVRSFCVAAGLCAAAGAAVGIGLSDWTRRAEIARQDERPAEIHSPSRSIAATWADAVDNPALADGR